MFFLAYLILMKISFFLVFMGLLLQYLINLILSLKYVGNYFSSLSLSNNFMPSLYFYHFLSGQMNNLAKSLSIFLCFSLMVFIFFVVHF